MGSGRGTQELETETETQKQAPPELEEKKAEPAGEAAEKKVKFQVLADAGVYYAGIPATAKIGHAWIRLLDEESGNPSYGFWPAERVRLAAMKSVKGAVRSPDNANSPTAIHTYEISAEKAQAVTRAAEAERAAPRDYNLFSHNCVHFAAEMAGVAGVSAPSFQGVLGIANPNALAQGIAAMNERDGKDAMGNDLPPEQRN
jgi:hypothetical protein